LKFIPDSQEAQRAAGVAAADIRPEPLANDRLWVHSTQNVTFELPDPDVGVGQAVGITQGPGFYMASNPERSAGRYGNRYFLLVR